MSQMLSWLLQVNVPTPSPFQPPKPTTSPHLLTSSMFSRLSQCDCSYPLYPSKSPLLPTPPQPLFPSNSLNSPPHHIPSFLPTASYSPPHPQPLFPSNSLLLPAPPPAPLSFQQPPTSCPLPHLLTSSVLSRVPSLLLLSVVVTSEESSVSILGARIKLGRSLPFLQNPQINIVS